MRVLLALVLVAAAEPPRAPTYKDDVYRFSVDAPKFPKPPSGQSAVPVAFVGHPEDGVSPNVNVLVLNAGVSAEQYRTMTLDQFKKAGHKVNAESKKKVSGRDAYQWDYEGAQQGKELRFLALAVSDRDKVFLITCTSVKSRFDRHQKEFQACLDSFKLD